MSSSLQVAGLKMQLVGGELNSKLVLLVVCFLPFYENGRGSCL